MSVSQKNKPAAGNKTHTRKQHNKVDEDDDRDDGAPKKAPWQLMVGFLFVIGLLMAYAVFAPH